MTKHRTPWPYRLSRRRKKVLKKAGWFPNTKKDWAFFWAAEQVLVQYSMRSHWSHP